MFGNLNDLRLRPVPALGSTRSAKRRYRDLPIEQSDLFTEPLVNAAAFGLVGRNYYAHTRNPPYWAMMPGAIDALVLRKSVGEKLAEIDSRLQHQGLKLFLYDAWRPRALQAHMHDVWVPAELRRRHPDWSAEAIATEVGRYWAAPSESALRPAPHATGGAVDITIVWDDGAPLWLGSLFDDATALANTDHFETLDEIAFSHEEARANRRMLYWLMIEGGFANHPDEWWHYSFGDQMWAANTGRAAAYYGEAIPDAALLAGAR